MRRPFKRERFLVASMLFASALSGCAPNETTFNQKLTLHFTTPEGPKAFSSVTTIRCTAGYALDVNRTKVTCRENGEAVVASLGGSYLFAALSGVALGYDRAFQSLRQDQPMKEKKFWRLIERAKGRRFDIPEENYPSFFAFEDVSVPASIAQIAPEDISSRFGPGFSLDKMSLTLVEEDPSRSIADILPWLDEYQTNQFRLNGERCAACPKDSSLPARVGPGQFRVETFILPD